MAYAQPVSGRYNFSENEQNTQVLILNALSLPLQIATIYGLTSSVHCTASIIVILPL